MNDGTYQGTYNISDIGEHDLISKMVGRKFTHLFPEYQQMAMTDQVLLDVKNISGKKFIKNATFQLRSGEILGISGLIGSGRTELVRLILGVDVINSGEMKLYGKRFLPHSPRDAINKNIGFVPEDRKKLGLFLQNHLLYNITLPSLLLLSRYLFMRLRFELDIAVKVIKELRIKVPTHLFPVENMSGGNQQKAILARWLCRDTKILILDEPTRGIDVGSKLEIYQIMLNFKKQGKGIIMISSELPEILGMSDRTLVMHNGKIIKELSRAEATEEKIMAYSLNHSPD